MQFTPLLSAALLAASAAAMPASAVDGVLGKRATCTVRGFTDETCSDTSDQGLLKTIPSSGSICFSVGPSPFRHSLSISAGCPTLKVVEFAGAGCTNQLPDQFTAGPGCKNFNFRDEAQSVRVSFN